MNKYRLGGPSPGVFATVVFLLVTASSALAQQLPWARFRPLPIRLRPIAGLRARVHNGELHLRLRDFLRLVLTNDPGIQVMRLQVVGSHAQVTSARAAFDPSMDVNFDTQRSTSPATTALAGAPTASTLLQNSAINFRQLLPWGQDVSIGFTATRNSNNSSFSLLNPSISSGLDFDLRQSLLQNWNNIQNRAPLRQAEYAWFAAGQTTRAQIADQLIAAARDYWSAVQASRNIDLVRQALGFDQKNYALDRRKLKLGAIALPDIYPTEAQVAEDKVNLLNAEYAYKLALLPVRREIGADLLPATRNLRIVLDDRPSAASAVSLGTVDIEAAIASALRSRPELAASEAQLRQDALSVRLGKDQFKPKLNLDLSYSASGVAGDTLLSGSSLGTGAVSNLGLASSLAQLFGFSAPTYGVSLSLHLPFRNSAAQAQLAQALVSRNIDRYNQRRERQQVVDDVTGAAIHLQAALAAVQAARIARDYMRKNVAGEEQKYRLGSITIELVLQAQRQLTTAENTLLNARIDYEVARLQWERATWTLLPGLGLHFAPLGGGKE